jgi:hypothetical protein
VSICPTGSPLALVPYVYVNEPPLDQLLEPHPASLTGVFPTASPTCADTMTGEPCGVVGTWEVSRVQTGGCGSLVAGSVDPAPTV